MQSTIRRLTATFSFKKPVIRVNSIPINQDETETTIEERTPLALVPPSSVLGSSNASSVTAVERDPYDAYIDPIGMWCGYFFAFVLFKGQYVQTRHID